MSLIYSMKKLDIKFSLDFPIKTEITEDLQEQQTPNPEAQEPSAFPPENNENAH